MRTRSLYTSQYRAIIFKQYVDMIQGGWLILFLRFALPLILVLVLYLNPLVAYYQSSDNLKPTIWPDEDMRVPKCFVLDDANGRYGFGTLIPDQTRNCKTLGFYPDNPYVRKVMKKVAEQSGLDFDTDLQGFSTRVEAENTLRQDPKHFTFMIGFDAPFEKQGSGTSGGQTVPSSDKEILSDLSILINYNQTLLAFPNFYAFYLRDQVSMSASRGMAATVPLRVQMALGRAILLVSEGIGVDFNPRLTQLPFFGRDDDPRLPDEFMSKFFVITVFLMQFLLSLSNSIAEKDSGRFESLRLMGVNDCIYILAQFSFQLLIFMITWLPYFIIAYMMPGGTDVYPWIDPVSFLVFNIMAAATITMFGLFFSSFLGTIKLGMSIGFVMVAGSFVETMVFTMTTPERIYDPTFINQFGAFLLQLLFPFTPIIQTTLQMVETAMPTSDANPRTFEMQLVSPKNPWTFSTWFTRGESSPCLNQPVDKQSICTYRAPPPVVYLVFMLLDTILYFLITWFVSEAVPSHSSLCRKPWQLFTKDYWSTSGEGYSLSSILDDRESRYRRRLAKRDAYKKAGITNAHTVDYSLDDEYLPLVDATGDVLERAPHTFRATAQQPDGTESLCCVCFRKARRQKGESDFLTGRQPVPGSVFEAVLRSLLPLDSKVSSVLRHTMTASNLKNTVLVTHHLQKTFVRKACSGSKEDKNKVGKYHYAVRGLTIRICHGQIFGLLGQNGAGKSTSINCIIGSLHPDKPPKNLLESPLSARNPCIGNGWIDDYSILYQMNHIRRKIGVCPQHNTTLWPGLTPVQHLKLVCLLHNIPEFEIPMLVEKHLRQVALYEYRDKPCKKFSGGMQRRLCIAIATCGYHKLLLFDEATTGTDPETKRIVWSAIQKTSRNHMNVPVVTGSAKGKDLHVKRIHRPPPGILLTSHDMTEVDYLSDEIAIMSSGKVIASGTSLELKRLYGSGYQFTIIASSTKAANVMSELVKYWLQQSYPEIEYVTKTTDTADFLREKSQPRIGLINQTGQSLVYSVNLMAEYALPGFILFVETHKTGRHTLDENSQEIVRDIPSVGSLSLGDNRLGSLGPLVADYQLEGTTLEEVFIKLGKIYQAGVFSQMDKYTSQQDALQGVNIKELANLSSTLDHTSPSNIDNKLPNQGSSALGEDQQLPQHATDVSVDSDMSDPALLKYTDAEAHDTLINGEEIRIEKFTPEMINEILNPRRVRPRVFTALLTKMYRYDASTKMGIFSVFFLPVLLIILGWILSDVFVPWLMGLLNSLAQRVASRSDSICTVCRMLKSFGGFGYIEDCDGYDTFGEPMACPASERFIGKVNSQPIIWLGGGTISESEVPDLLPNGTDLGTKSIRYSNMMQRRGGTGRIYVFDKTGRFGSGIDETIVLQDALRGHRMVYSYNLTVNNTTIPFSSVDYKVFTVMGLPVSSSIKNQVSVAMSSFMSTKFDSLFTDLSTSGGTNYLDYFSVKPLAVPMYTSTTTISDDFQLKPDFYFVNGYSKYDTIDTLLDELLYIQRSGGIPRPEGTVYYDRCYSEPVECGNLTKRVYVDPTDLATIQQCYNYVLSKVPLAVLEFDTAESYSETGGIKVLRPVIHSYLPAKLGNYPYKRLTLRLRFNTTSIVQRAKEFGINDIMSMPGTSVNSSITLPPAKAPSIIEETSLLDTRAITIHNEVHARLVEAIARASYGISPAASYTSPATSINIRFGLQPWDWVWTFPITSGEDKMKVMLALIMLALACMSMVPMHMFPVVLDRQQGLRQMFKLNGVPTWLYWCANFIYQLCFAVLVYSVMVVLGYFVFKLSLLRKMDFGMILLVFTAGAYGQLTTAFLFSLFFPNTQLSTLVGNILIIVLAIVLMIEGEVQTENLLWWYFFTPMMSFAAILGFVGWSAQDFKSFMNSPMRWLILGMWVEGTIFFLLTIYFDYIIPRESNGVPLPWNFIFTCCCKRSKSSNGASTFNLNNADLVSIARDSQLTNGSASTRLVLTKAVPESTDQLLATATMLTDVSTITGISALEADSVEGCRCQTSPGSLVGCGIEEETDGTYLDSSTYVRPPINVQLNAMPTHRKKALPPPRTGRDYAVRTGQAEMDIDVLAERQYMYNGIRSTTPVIVCNLQKFYPPAFVAVRDVSFHLPRSTCFAFLGSNGAGKSTTISMMTGLIKPTKGTVIINGWDVRRDPSEIYKSIGLCPQHDAYIPILSVRDHLTLFARLHGVSKADEKNVVEKLASFVYLYDVLDRQARQLSGGMRRRLSLALALIG
ncbi:ABC transporter family protein [Giardia duodenalis]|uniref:ABC transporter family protein n=1 Tax=Giardia intestinalis (strain ATCC 50803 / WB clone C6) TaxID=184922 RepID=A8B361_GIAIC|nr:ABC transporter family protein [Giardia intestinalis]KAE8303106.1 ABC transporter family protein [Giardia intestinalis]|eukprot:XP_001710133.1 ABC transporter family protein [Giardia lamblia ATCC 50803]